MSQAHPTDAQIAYGLYENGKLIQVLTQPNRPSLTDFTELKALCATSTYQIVVVSVFPLKTLANIKFEIAVDPGSEHGDYSAQASLGEQP